MEKDRLIEHLNACADACDRCYNGCLNEEEVSIMTRCIELGRECSDMCRLTASIIARDSENTDKFLRLCAEICEICAEECEKHDKNHCIECAKICRMHLEEQFNPVEYLL